MKKILIVEDNPMTMDLVTDLLASFDWEPLQAYDGETGLVFAEQYQPDLILLDIHLPGKHGYEVCGLLKNNPITKDIPVIAFTALSSEQDRQKALMCGCQDVISKPFDINTFSDILDSYLAS